MSEDIQTLLAEKEAALVGELEKVRAARAALGGMAAAKTSRGLKAIPKVQMTTADDDGDAGSLPAPQRHMSRAARKKLSDNMKARWKALKAAKAPKPA